MSSDIIVFKCTDDKIIVRHKDELPPNSIFHKSSAPLTDLQRPFPIPFSSNVLQFTLYHFVEQSLVNVAPDAAQSVCNFLGFTHFQPVESKKKPKKKNQSLLNSLEDRPYFIALDPDADTLLLRIFRPTDDSTASLDTISLPKTQLLLNNCSDVNDYFSRSPDSIKGSCDDVIQFIKKHLSLPFISKKEASDLADTLPKAFNLYKKYLTQFNPNNPYHLWAFWRDSFFGKWKDTAIAIVHSMDQDSALHFILNLWCADLTGWTGMTGGYNRCIPETMLSTILFKGRYDIAKKTKHVLLHHLVQHYDVSHHVHPLCLLSDSQTRVSTCSGCITHLDFILIHKSYTSDLRDLNPFFFSGL